jgi:hypothetical protein
MASVTLINGSQSKKMVGNVKMEIIDNKFFFYTEKEEIIYDEKLKCFLNNGKYYHTLRFDLDNIS